MKSLLSLLVALAVLLPNLSAEAKCARAWIGAFLATPSDTPLPADARLIVLESSTREGTYPEGDYRIRGDASLRAYHLESASGDTIALTPMRIGPSVIALTPASAPADGAWTVKGLSVDATVTFSKDATKPAPPAAPEATSVTATHGAPYGRGWRSQDIAIALSKPAPEGVVAVLGEWNRRMKKTELYSEGAAHVIAAGAETGPLYDWPGRCGASPDTFSLPEADAEATITFIDAYGQLSAPATVKVTRINEEKTP